MKRTLLFCGLLGLASQTQAQSGYWSMVNTPVSNIFGQYDVTQVHTLSPTLMWGLTQERIPSSATHYNTYVVTNNPTGAGDTYDFGEIQVTSSATVGNISGISATRAVAAAYPGSAFSGPATYGGEIVRTTNAGRTWTKVTTATQFTGTGAFCNWVHMFNATTGVALGNPTTVGGPFEILRTTDGGLTWNSVANVPAAMVNERGEPGAFYASDTAPGTLWAGLASSVETNTVRTLKTIDYGQTWIVSNPVPNIVGGVAHLAFTANNLNGLAYGFTKTNGVVTALNVARTTDGGHTWVAIIPNRTPTGSFFCKGIDAVDNRFYSTGPRDAVRPAVITPDDFGTSYSLDGINWTNMGNSATLAYPGFFCMDLLSFNTIAPFTTGHGGFYTDPNGVGGIYKFYSIVTATRDAALQRTLTVSPNPSASGVFNVALGAPLTTDTELTVQDALGRTVLTQPLTATTVGTASTRLDLHREKPGVYVLRLRTGAGIATQKMVIE